ncbi:MAG: tetratricopeptide repeat protein, partial [Blastocatellia bacterium]|nr:tetratricopeptide repeat protein [Blastocatellia bacterium]
MSEPRTLEACVPRGPDRLKAELHTRFLFLFLITLMGITGLAQVQADSLDSALALHDPAERIAALQQFLKSNNEPEKSQAAREAIAASYAQIAEAQLAGNNIENAVADFQKAIAALPESVRDRFFADTVLRIPQAVSVRGYRTESIDLARQLEKLFAEEPERLGSLGEFYMSIEAPVDAIRVLESAVSLKSEANLHRLLGAAYRTGLRLDDAVAEIQHAIKLDPNDKRAYYDLANLYRALGAYSDAINLYRKQLDITPDHSPTIKGLALTYLAKGDEAQATATLGQLAKLGTAQEEITKDIYLQTQLSFYYLQLGKMKQARAAADAALSVEPRYSWARIAAAETDLAEGKFFDAERNLLAAKQYAGFPTLLFTIGKLYLAVEDFEGALDQFAKAFNYSLEGGFSTRLGGVLEVQAENLKQLLAREQQAAIFLADPPTTDEQFKMIESLVRFNYMLRAIKSGPEKTNVEAAVSKKQLMELDRAATDFMEAERTRRPFRTLYIAQQLANAGIATGTAVELADLALSMAKSATEFDGSLRDYPNYDRDGRLMIFRGRALDAKGLALFKSGRNREAAGVLGEAVKAYGSLPENKRAIRHLAAALEAEGELSDALDLYIDGYEPPETQSGIDLERSVIEGLYRKLYGSLVGLDERLKWAGDSSRTGLGAILATVKPQAKGTEKKKVDEKVKETTKDRAVNSAPTTPIAVTPTPIVLPDAKPEMNLYFPQTSTIDGERLLLPLGKSSIESEELPPSPLQTQAERYTRKRRVTVPDQIESQSETPQAEKTQAEEPRVYQRKRR